MRLLVSENSSKFRILFLLVFFISSMVLMYSSSQSLDYFDEEVYYKLANNLNKDMGYVYENKPTAYRPIGYPYFLSLVMTISDSIIFLKIVNILTYILAILMFYKVLDRYSGEASLYFLAIASIYPFFIYASGLLYPQGLEAFGLALVIYLLLENKQVYTFIASVVFGLTMLAVSGFIFTLPIFLIYLLLNTSSFRNNLLSALIFFLGVAVTVSPWIYRNSQLFNQPVFLSTNGGFNLLLGNSENTKYDSGVRVDLSSYLKYSRANGYNEAEKDKYLKETAIEWIMSNPYDAFKLYLQKALYYYSYTNTLATENKNSKLRELVGFFSYYPLLILALIRLLLYKKIPISKIEALFYFIYIANGLLSAIFFTRIRFRIPFDFLLIALVSFCLCHLKYIYYQARKKCI